VRRKAVLSHPAFNLPGGRVVGPAISIPEDELFQLLEDLSKRHGFALESVG
jgi:hypothetical protein